MPKPVALSKGVPTDNTTIQILETLSVMAFGLGVVALFDRLWIKGALCVALGAIGLALTFFARRSRGFRNETAMENEYYWIPGSRRQTISLALPTDVHQSIIFDQTVSRREIAAELRLNLGDQRSTQYLPLVLSYADHVPPSRKQTKTNAREQPTMA